MKLFNVIFAFCLIAMATVASAAVRPVSQIDPLFPTLPKVPCTYPFVVNPLTGATMPAKCNAKSCKKCCTVKGIDYYCDPQTGTCRPCERCPPGYFSVGCKLGKPRCLSCCAADSPELCKRCIGNTSTTGTPPTIWVWDATKNVCVEKSTAVGK